MLPRLSLNNSSRLSFGYAETSCNFCNRETVNLVVEPHVINVSGEQLTLTTSPSPGLSLLTDTILSVGLKSTQAKVVRVDTGGIVAAVHDDTIARVSFYNQVHKPVCSKVLFLNFNLSVAISKFRGSPKPASFCFLDLIHDAFEDKSFHSVHSLILAHRDYEVKGGW